MFKQKTKILAWLARLLVFSLLLGLFPQAALAATQPAGTPVSLDWIRSAYQDPAVSARSDDLPPVDRAGNVYTVDGMGYLSCVQPDQTLKWKVNLGQKGNYQATGGVGPVLDTQGNCYIGSGDKQVYAISSEGQVIWTYQMKEAVAVSTSPALSADQSTLYVVTSAGLYALRTKAEGELKAGTSRWDQVPLSLSGSYKSTPVVADGVIYIPAYTYLNAVNPDGTLKWSKQLANNSLQRADGQPVTGGTYLAYAQAEQSSTSGELRSKADSSSGLYLLTTNYIGNVIRTDQNRLWHFNSKGLVEWSVDIDQTVSAPAYDQGSNTLYYHTADNKLYAISTDNGVLKWSYAVTGELNAGAATSNYRGAPAIGPDGTIYTNVGTRVYAFDPAPEAENRLKWKSIPPREGNFIMAVVGPGPQGEIYACTAGSLARFTDPDFKPVALKLELADQNDQEGFSMLIGGNYQLPVRLLDTYGSILSDQGLVWESTVPGVVKVQGGLLTALAAGTAQIKAFYPGADSENGDLRLTVDVKVLTGSQGVTLTINPGNTEVYVGENKQLQALITDPNGKFVRGAALEWKSDAQPVATVDALGLVTTLKTGGAKISVRVPAYSTLQNSIAVTVKERPIVRVEAAAINVAISRTASYIKSNSGSNLADWEVFGLNAAGQTFDKETYLGKLKASIQNNSLGSLPTDYARTALSIISSGGNPQNFMVGEQSYNFIQKITNASLNQGINAAIWGLIAFDGTSANVPSASPNSREALIEHILANKVKEGWSYSGGLPDVDMTGMALYALAPYRERPAVKSAGEDALQWLSKNQLENGKFGSWGTTNCESTAQAIMGITAWGLDPQSSAYTKAKGNAVSALLSYQTDSGVFKHVDIQDPSIATPQGLEGLAAVARFMKKGRSDIFENIGAYNSDPLTISLLKITPATLEIETGKSIHMKAFDQNGNSVSKDAGGNSLLEWSSSDPAIASIDQEGKVTAQRPGIIDARATLKNTAIFTQVRVAVVGQDFTMVGKSNPPTLSVIGDGGLEQEITIKNISEQTQTALIIMVLYQKDTRSIVQQSYLEKTLAPGEEYTFSGGFRLPAGDKNYEIKVLTWNSWLKGRPLVDVDGT